MPTNGLIGWWPYNGNANDESGNARNGTLTVSNSVCSSVSAIVNVIVNANPVAEIVDTVVYTNRGANAVFSCIQNNPNTLYKWQIGQNNNWIDLSNNSTYSGVSTYQLTVYNVDSTFSSYRYRLVSVNNICYDTSEVGTIVINNWNVPTEYTQKNDLEIYPNPFRDQIFIEIKNLNESTISFRLFDVLGNLILNEAVSQENFILNLDYLSSGIYFLEFYDENLLSKHRKKIVKQ